VTGYAAFNWVWVEEEGPVKLGLKPSKGLRVTAMGAVLSLGLVPAAWTMQEPIPDAPAPQRTSPPLSEAAGGPIKPGGGAGVEKAQGSSSAGGPTETKVPQQPSTQAPPAEPQKDVQSTPPENLSPQDIGQIYRLYTTLVNVPVR